MISKFQKWWTCLPNIKWDAAVFLAFIVSFVLLLQSGFQLWWTSQQKEIQAALIGVAATVVIGLLGFRMIAWQISAQARRSLYVDVYKQFLDAIRTGQNAQSEYMNLLSKLEWDTSMYLHMKAGGLNWNPTTVRIEPLMNARRNYSKAVIGVIEVIERWRIIDPKIYLIQAALSASLEDTEEAWNEYFQFILRNSIAPRDDGTDWSPPSGETHKQFEKVAEKLSGVNYAVLGFLIDCHAEIQFMLIGGLFGNQIVRREKVGPGVIVLRLDKYNELMKLYSDRRTHVVRTSKMPFGKLPGE